MGDWNVGDTFPKKLWPKGSPLDFANAHINREVEQ